MICISPPSVGKEPAVQSKVWGRGEACVCKVPSSSRDTSPPRANVSPCSYDGRKPQCQDDSCSNIKCLIVLPDEQVFLVLNHTRWQVALGHSCCWVCKCDDLMRNTGWRGRIESSWEIWESVPVEDRKRWVFPSCGDGIITQVFHQFCSFNSTTGLICLLIQIWTHLKYLLVQQDSEKHGQNPHRHGRIAYTSSLTKLGTDKNIVEKKSNFKRKKSTSVPQKSSTEKYYSV